MASSLDGAIEADEHAFQGGQQHIGQDAFEICPARGAPLQEGWEADAVGQCWIAGRWSAWGVYLCRLPLQLSGCARQYEAGKGPLHQMQCRGPKPVGGLHQP